MKAMLSYYKRILHTIHLCIGVSLDTSTFMTRVNTFLLIIILQTVLYLYLYIELL